MSAEDASGPALGDEDEEVSNIKYQPVQRKQDACLCWLVSPSSPVAVSRTCTRARRHARRSWITPQPLSPHMPLLPSSPSRFEPFAALRFSSTVPPYLKFCTTHSPCTHLFALLPPSPSPPCSHLPSFVSGIRTISPSHFYHRGLPRRAGCSAPPSLQLSTHPPALCFPATPPRPRGCPVPTPWSAVSGPGWCLVEGGQGVPVITATATIRTVAIIANRHL